MAKKDKEEKKEKQARLNLDGLDMEEIVEQMNAKYGENTLALASEALGLKVRFISTGVYDLDFGLGGGIPENRLTELRGPFSSLKSTISYKVITNFQHKYEDGMAFFEDREHSFDPVYARRCGVDLTRLLIINSDSGEQAIDILADLISVRKRSILAVVDSVAALVPSAELESSAEQQFQGLHPRLVNKMMRILTSGMKRNLYDNEAPTITVLLTNQLREKTGVIYGCLRGDVRIPFTDGTNALMRDVVKQRIKKSVWTYSLKEDKFKPAKIINWFYNGKVDKPSDYLHLKFSGACSKNGSLGVMVTPDHKVLTSLGWKKAGELADGDLVLSSFPSRLNGTLLSFLLGVTCGDSYLDKGSTSSANLRLEDTHNPDYVEWKKEKLSSFLHFRKTRVFNHQRNQEYLAWTSQREPCLAHLRDSINGRNFLLSVLKNPAFSWLSLAVWFMDDGSTIFRDRKSRENEKQRLSLNMKRFSNNKMELRFVHNWFFSHGMFCRLKLKYGNLVFTVEGARKLCEKIAHFIPPTMQYKLLPEYRGRYVPFDLSSRLQKEEKFLPVKISKAKRVGGCLDKYDLAVEGIHNYLAGGKENGVVVHNSPETTPGGRGKDFAYSVMIRFSSSPGNKMMMKVSQNGITRELKFGQEVDFNISKNKVSGSQYEQGTFTYYTRPYKGHSPFTFNNEDSLFRYGAFFGIIKCIVEKKSVRYKYKNIGPYVDSKFPTALIGKTELCNELYEKILQAVLQEQSEGHEPEDIELTIEETEKEEDEGPKLKSRKLKIRMGK